MSYALPTCGALGPGKSHQGHQGHPGPPGPPGATRATRAHQVTAVQVRLGRIVRHACACGGWAGWWLHVVVGGGWLLPACGGGGGGLVACGGVCGGGWCLHVVGGWLADSCMCWWWWGGGWGGWLIPACGGVGGGLVPACAGVCGGLVPACGGVGGGWCVHAVGGDLWCLHVVVGGGADACVWLGGVDLWCVHVGVGVAVVNFCLPPCCLTAYSGGYRRDPRTRWLPFLPVAYASYSGLIGSFSVFFGKTLATLLSTTIQGDSQVDSWYPWFFLFLFGLSSLFWVTRLNEVNIWLRGVGGVLVEMKWLGVH